MLQDIFNYVISIELVTDQFVGIVECWWYCGWNKNERYFYWDYV